MTAPDKNPPPTRASLATKARALPVVPGAYLMKDAAETVIYVGL